MWKSVLRFSPQLPRKEAEAEALRGLQPAMKRPGSEGPRARNAHNETRGGQRL